MISGCNWNELQCVTSLIKEAVDLIFPGITAPKTMHDSCMSPSRIADRRLLYTDKKNKGYHDCTLPHADDRLL